MIICSCCGKQLKGMLKNPDVSFHCGDCRERVVKQENKQMVGFVYAACVVIGLVIVILEKAFCK